MSSPSVPSPVPAGREREAREALERHSSHCCCCPTLDAQSIDSIVRVVLAAVVSSSPATPAEEGEQRLRRRVENLANDDVLCGPWCNERRSLCQTLQKRINDWLDFNGEPAAPPATPEGGRAKLRPCGGCSHVALCLVDQRCWKGSAAPSTLPAETAEEKALTDALQQRDDAEEWADRLAAAIASATRVPIGEHSSGNNPWANALHECNRLTRDGGWVS